MLAAPLWTQEEATGLAALGVDLTSLIVYVVNFGILLIILYLVGYKRILGIMDQRSQRIKDSLEEADRVRQDSQDRQAEVQRALDEGRQESLRLLAETRDVAERLPHPRAHRKIGRGEEPDRSALVHVELLD